MHVRPAGIPEPNTFVLTALYIVFVTGGRLRFDN
jgi:hypothetical protein